MSDNMLVNRYTEYLISILFNRADPWLKEKYKLFKGAGGQSFFERMQEDLKKRESKKAEEEAKAEAAQRLLTALKSGLLMGKLKLPEKKDNNDNKEW